MSFDAHNIGLVTPPRMFKAAKLQGSQNISTASRGGGGWPSGPLLPVQLPTLFPEHTPHCCQRTLLGAGASDLWGVSSPPRPAEPILGQNPGVGGPNKFPSVPVRHSASGQDGFLVCSSCSGFQLRMHYNPPGGFLGVTSAWTALHKGSPAQGFTRRCSDYVWFVFLMP